jgi:hypothetical protein
MQTANPRELLLIGLIVAKNISMVQLEYYAHRVFYQMRERGEWFRVEGDLVPFLHSINIGKPISSYAVEFPYRKWMEKDGLYWKLRGKENPNRVAIEDYVASLPY